MKVLTLLPKEIKDKYYIERENDALHLHTFGYINIDIDEKFSVTDEGTTWAIRNSRVCVTLWKKNITRHITVYP